MHFGNFRLVLLVFYGGKYISRWIHVRTRLAARMPRQDSLIYERVTEGSQILIKDCREPRPSSAGTTGTQDAG